MNADREELAARLAWAIDADWPDLERAQIATSGAVQVGNVRRSGSGRWRWEIASLPGDGGFRDDRNGWRDSEDEAKSAVEAKWAAWVAKTALRSQIERVEKERDEAREAYRALETRFDLELDAYAKDSDMAALRERAEKAETALAALAQKAHDNG
ncbi:MAG TPA: hypothetical protein VMF90_12140 [Rhizobiaceae bacterium]|nr:hypothetical protein [Rhizobiaceae bacterium]